MREDREFEQLGAGRHYQLYSIAVAIWPFALIFTYLPLIQYSFWYVPPFIVSMVTVLYGVELVIKRGKQVAKENHFHALAVHEHEYEIL